MFLAEFPRLLNFLIKSTDILQPYLRRRMFLQCVEGLIVLHRGYDCDKRCPRLRPLWQLYRCQPMPEASY